MWAFLGVLLLLLHQGVAQRHDSDLYSFVTLPEVRALKFDVTHIDRERQLPGYWFIAPYGQINPETPTHKYEQYQIGPYIYDNEGELVWAGSPLTENRNVFDFKANWNIDKQPHLSFILQHEYDNSDKGSGVIMNNQYEFEHHVGVINDLNAFNMHEFNVLDGGKTALACTYRSRQEDLAAYGRPGESTWLTTGGFVELSVDSADILFEWDSHKQIPISESVKFHPQDHPVGPPGSDYVHINAVDKNAAGDYIISMRFTNTIYMISGQDGEIMWRLGGEHSDFDIDFTFSKQHDVKFLESNGTHHVISLMNNASDEAENEEEVSSALFIEVDDAAMTAKVVKRIDRPDGGLTRLRGNAQALPNGNTFVGWSQWGYHSEHAPNGDMLMFAQFPSERFSSYRSYKFDWVGRPTTPPDLVASVYGTDDEDMMTIIHISWNGATEVAGYDFYARAHENSDDVLIGHANKTGFETMFISDGYLDWISAEAVDRNGEVLGKSNVQRPDTPRNWKASGFGGSSTPPSPDDPAVIQAWREDLKSSGGAEFIGNGNATDSSGSIRQSSVYNHLKEMAKSVYGAYGTIRLMGGALFTILLICVVGGVIGGMWHFLRRRRRMVRPYHHVPSSEGQSVEEIPLRFQHTD